VATQENPFTIEGNALIVIAVTVVLAFVLRWVVHRLTDRLARSMANNAITRRMATSPVVSGQRAADAQAIERYRARIGAVSSLLKSLVTVSLFGLAFLIVLSELGVNMAPLLASAGLVGIAVGFGAQSLVKDFLSGIFMILEDQYGVGDVIDIGDAVGTVERVGLRVTELRDASGVVWYVPNGTIGALGNRSQGYGLAVADVPIPYGEDVEAVSGVLRAEAIAFGRDPEWADFVLDEEPIVAVETMTPVAVTFRVQVQTVPGKHLVVARALRVRLMAALEAAGVRPPTSGPAAQLPLTDTP
jgi:small conductance mechanosensitive channel